MTSVLFVFAFSAPSAACGGSAVEDAAPSNRGGGGGSAGAGSGATAGNGGTAGSAACEQAKLGYAALLGSLPSSTDAGSCTQDSDCTSLETGECGSPCSLIILSAKSSVGIASKLSDYAITNCASCNFIIPPCPLSISNPVCVGSACLLYYPL